jgi:hypothetical protein
MFIVMKTWIILLLACSFNLHAEVFAQQENVRLSVENASLAEIFRQIRQASGYTFVYDSDAIKEQAPVSLSIDAPIDEVLESCLKDTGFTFFIDDNIVIIRATRPARQQQARAFRVGGVVTDARRVPLAGVNVRLKESTMGVSTDVNGRYTFVFPEVSLPVLVFSYIGMVTREVPYAGQETLDIVLEEDARGLENVVVTGIYSRQREHFTGSSATFTQGELKMVGNQNILQSLRTLDPSFAIIENNQWGSDPNRVPDIEIRGKSSVIGLTEEFGTDPNQPLFILDGFETTLATISDLSMDRVESITILKDAASIHLNGKEDSYVHDERFSFHAGTVHVS